MISSHPQHNSSLLVEAMLVLLLKLTKPSTSSCLFFRAARTAAVACAGAAAVPATTWLTNSSIFLDVNVDFKAEAVALMAIYSPAITELEL
jgi:hypothetical protein